MIYSVWLYRFQPGLTEPTLAELRKLGLERVYPGVEKEGGKFLGRVWGHPNYTYGSAFRRNGAAGVRAETGDLDSLLRTLRILSPSLAAMEVRNVIPRDDAELKELGDDGWHSRAVGGWIDAARQTPEVAHHLNVIGFACLKANTFPPYMVQAVWRDKLGFPPKWLGATDSRARFRDNAD
jgi:hypothetical protein